MFIRLYILWIALFSWASTPAHSLTCENVISVDQKTGMNGALSVIYGCTNSEPDKIRQLQKSPNDTIRMFFTNEYYVGASQPFVVSEQEWLNALSTALANKEPESIIRILYWSDAGYEYQNFELKDLGILDPETIKVFNLYRAAASLAADGTEPYAWKLDTIEAVEILLASKTIPIAADYLSFAYLQGYGVRTDIDLAMEYNNIAAEALPEAKRYKAVLASENGEDTETILSLYRDAAATGYVKAILEIAELLSGYIQYDSSYEKEFLSYFSKLEVLGYAGHSEAQSAIAYAYNQGTGVARDEEMAEVWYKKAADNGSRDAMAMMMTWAAEAGSYDQYLKYALIRAKWGNVENDGYLAAILAVYASNKSSKEKTKLIQFILDHCRNNIYVDDTGYEICANFPVKQLAFEPAQDLLLALGESSKIRFKNELNLPTGQYRALLIANQSYQYWGDLQTPVSDINSIGKRLLNDYSFEVEMLQDASRKEILSKIYELGSKSEFNDHVLIYYAGHGIVDLDTNEGYWIPAQADQSFRPDWVSNSEIKTALKSIKAKHLLVMADSCYSGTLVRSGSALSDNISGPVIERLFSKKARVAITSGGNEPVVDKVGNSNNSIFAQAFISALDENFEKFVPASVFFQKIREQVTQNANQTPLYSNIAELSDDGGEFVFQKNR